MEWCVRWSGGGLCGVEWCVEWSGGLMREVDWCVCGEWWWSVRYRVVCEVEW